VLLYSNACSRYAVLCDVGVVMRGGRMFGRGFRRRRVTGSRAGAWYELVARAAWEYLDEIAAAAQPLEEPVASSSESHEIRRPSTAQESSAELSRLVLAWRALLRLHDPDPRRCEWCRGASARSTRLCGVWQVAVAYFVRDGTRRNTAAGAAAVR